jgi:hypothetical protein
VSFNVIPADPSKWHFPRKGGIGLFEGDLIALMDELGFNTLTSPTNSPVIGPESSSQLFFVSSTEFGMIF